MFNLGLCKSTMNWVTEAEMGWEICLEGGVYTFWRINKMLHDLEYHVEPSTVIIDMIIHAMDELQ